MPLAPGVAGTARGLLRRPGFALGAILTLAVAIGVNAAVFSVVDAALLRPLPFPEPDRLSFLTLPERVMRAGAPQRFNARVVSIFGVLAVALALQGLYGLLSFVVERSRRDIGVRLSMGARKEDVVRLVAGRGLGFVALGLAAGLPAAYAVARAASAVLFGITPADLSTYALAAAALATATACACLVPALRAARLDPAAILREP